MEESISVRISKKDLKEIKFLSDEERKKRSDVLRDVINEGIMKRKLDLALRRFQNNEATASKAASIAGIPLTLFLDVLSQRKIEFHYDLEELREDFKDLL